VITRVAAPVVYPSGSDCPGGGAGGALLVVVVRGCGAGCVLGVGVVVGFGAGRDVVVRGARPADVVACVLGAAGPASIGTCGVDGGGNGVSVPCASCGCAAANATTAAVQTPTAATAPAVDAICHARMRASVPGMEALLSQARAQRSSSAASMRLPSGSATTAPK
jgi:hypothetical protein